MTIFELLICECFRLQAFEE